MSSMEDTSNNEEPVATVEDLEAAAPPDVTPKASEDHTEATHADEQEPVTEVSKFPEEQAKKTDSRKLSAGWKLSMALLAIATVVVIVVPILVVKLTDRDGELNVEKVIDGEKSPLTDVVEASPTICSSNNVLRELDQPTRVVVRPDSSADNKSWIRLTGTGDLMLLTAPATCGVELQVYQAQILTSYEECSGVDALSPTAVRGEAFTESCEKGVVTTTRTSPVENQSGGINSIGSSGSGVYWQSLPGRTYYIKIESDDDDEALTNELLFTLQTFPDGSSKDVINNHFCLGAQGPMELGVPVPVSTASGTQYDDSIVSFMAQSEGQSNANLVELAMNTVSYYSITGTGKRLTLELGSALELGLAENYVVVPAIIRGDCSGIRTFITDVEMKPRDDVNGIITFSSISWSSNVGEQYIVSLVTASSKPVTFEMTLSEETETSSPLIPEISPTIPANDLCANAIELSLEDDMSLPGGAVTVSGTVKDSTFEDLGYSRYNWGSGFGFEDEFVDQPGVVCSWIHGPGVWYKIKGRGMGIQVSTGCSIEEEKAMPSLSVFQGAGCGSLSCVVNYRTSCSRPGGSWYGGDSTLSWFGEAGTMYYVYVQSSRDASADQTFELEVTEFTTPSNDVCSGATPLEVGATELVSTKFATPEFVGNYRLRDWDGTIFPGVFFDVVGTGNVMKVAAACDDSGSPTVHVYQGDCEAKQIVGEKVVCDPESAAYWESVEGEVYHILYQSDTDTPKELTITEERPEMNDLCTGAIMLKPGSITNGDTSIARFSQYYRRQRKNRNLLSFMPPGLHYWVIGTGKVMQISAPCDGDAYEGVSISVTSGPTCQERSYLGGANERSTTCDPDTTLTWPAFEGEVYHIEVTPYFGGGPFSFTLTELDP